MFSLRNQPPKLSLTDNPVVDIIEEHPIAALAGAWLIGLAAVRLVRPAIFTGVALAVAQTAKKACAALPGRAAPTGGTRKRPAAVRASNAKNAKAKTQNPKGASRKAVPRKRSKKTPVDAKSMDTVH